MNRLGTNPIEHDFGIIRMRSKDHHRAERFIKEAEKVNALQKLRENMVIENIKHRDLQFGRVVNKMPIQINFMMVGKNGELINK